MMRYASILTLGSVQDPLSNKSKMTRVSPSHLGHGLGGLQSTLSTPAAAVQIHLKGPRSKALQGPSALWLSHPKRRWLGQTSASASKLCQLLLWRSYPLCRTLRLLPPWTLCQGFLTRHLWMPAALHVLLQLPDQGIVPLSQPNAWVWACALNKPCVSDTSTGRCGMEEASRPWGAILPHEGVLAFPQLGESSSL